MERQTHKTILNLMVFNIMFLLLISSFRRIFCRILNMFQNMFHQKALSIKKDYLQWWQKINEVTFLCKNAESVLSLGMS